MISSTSARVRCELKPYLSLRVFNELFICVRIRVSTYVIICPSWFTSTIHLEIMKKYGKLRERKKEEYCWCLHVYKFQFNRNEMKQCFFRFIERPAKVSNAILSEFFLEFLVRKQNQELELLVMCELMYQLIKIFRRKIDDKKTGRHVHLSRNNLSLELWTLTNVKTLLLRDLCQCICVSFFLFHFLLC